MTQKLQNLKNKLHGSILAYTLIVLTIMLMTALSIASVTVLDKKSASSTAGSTQAFANADSGAEMILGYRYRQGDTELSNIDDANPNASCDPADGTIIIDNVNGGTARITLYSDTDGTTQLDCNDAGNTLAQVQKVKSVGSYSGSSRAVEVAVAAGCHNGRTKIHSSSTEYFDSTDYQFIRDYLEDEQNGHIVGFYCKKTNDWAVYAVVNSVILDPATGGGAKSVSFITSGAFISCDFTAGRNYCTGSSICTAGWDVYAECTCASSC